MKKEIENLKNNKFSFFVQDFERKKEKEISNKNIFCEHVIESDLFTSRLKIDDYVFNISDTKYKIKEFEYNRNYLLEENCEFIMSGRLISINGYDFEMVYKDVSRSSMDGIKEEKYYDKIPKDVINFINEIKNYSLEKNISLMGKQEDKKEFNARIKEKNNLLDLKNRLLEINKKINFKAINSDRENIIKIFSDFEKELFELKINFKINKKINKDEIEVFLKKITNLFAVPDGYFSDENKIKNLEELLASYARLMIINLAYDDIIVNSRSLSNKLNEILNKYKSEYSNSKALEITMVKIKNEINNLVIKNKEEESKNIIGKRFMDKINNKRSMNLIRLPEFILKKILIDRVNENSYIQNSIDINHALNNSSNPNKLLEYFLEVEDSKKESAVLFASNSDSSLINSVINKFFKNKKR